MKTRKVAIVGAGAAGCFCAANLKRMLPEADVTVYERARRPLAKVAVTGGGRCNLTNSFRDISDLSQAYPRGARLMQRLFRQFSPEDTRAWWEAAGVPLLTQEDQCVFPRSQDAMQVVRTLLREMQSSGVRLLTGCAVSAIRPRDGGYEVETQEGAERFDTVVVTTGGSPRLSGLSFLSPLGVETVPPVPSLFALNLGDEALHALTGTVVADTPVAIAGTRLKAEGPLLITHFGMSGPAVLRLSSYGARHLAERDYRVTLSVNWMQGMNDAEVNDLFQAFYRSEKLVLNHHPEHLTARHWGYLLQRAQIPDARRWDHLNQKERNRLVAVLTADLYATQGRRQYKAEFVTCGGVSLRSINPDTLALKTHPNIYLAGEVLDIDAVTGGFNLQAAWTTGFVVAHSIAHAG